MSRSVVRLVVRDAAGVAKVHEVKLDEQSTLKDLLEELKLIDDSMDNESVHLLHRGRVLNVESKAAATSLKELGVTSNSSIHAVSKSPEALKSETEKRKKESMSEGDLRQIALALGMAMRDSALSRVITRLVNDPGAMESIAVACPDLKDDHEARALLETCSVRGPELLMSLLQPEALNRAQREHPSLVEAIQFLSAAVHEERALAPAPRSRSTPSDLVPDPMSYSLEAMDDIEEVVDDNNADDHNQRAQNASSNRAMITPEQLAAALAAAQGEHGLARQRNHHHHHRQHHGHAQGRHGNQMEASGPQQMITTDMFHRAMQEALMASQVDRPAPSTSSGEGSGNVGAPDWSSELSRMREMGITDEQLARKALTIMNGDLQAAVDLIFSGWLGEDDSMA